MDKNISYHDRLLKIREENRLTQSEFARKLGVKQSYYSELERGKRDLTTKVIEAIINNFEVSADWLITGKEDAIQSNITNSDNGNMLIENNKEFIDNYMFGGLGSYDKRQISYYENYNKTQLNIIRKDQLSTLKDTYISTKNLIDFVNYLEPKELELMDKFYPIPTFEERLKGLYQEFEDLIEDAGGLTDERLKIILEILYFEEEKKHWDMVLQKLLGILFSYRIIFKSRVNNPFFEKK